ncbi:unnamed protein product [Didymodactylos carnosus]|uniref:Uncharacterized protein n=1 Tax=Didymodactylos carnosus TaxID=1234261 RepID=A0A814H5V9_9BILA|nr:unnamed protein product [Didymodactylos carnosus]CAF1006214.1 unnamed protein product [Didymodactylos carnosus]CAF3614208.1 unnamed protein product [Didymodactylos carnosus]CAF3777414.1 unnamed protein product [Didymodactylos carnosus]
MMKFDSINLQSHVVKHQQQNINNLNINNIDDNEQIWVLREPFKTMSKLKTVLMTKNRPRFNESYGV